MLAKYDTLLTKDQNVHGVLLSSVHLRSASLQLSRWEKHWSFVPHSIKVQMDRRISSKVFDLEVLES